MTWAELPANKTVTAIPPTKEELANLRSIVARSLADVTAPGLSADSRFIMAYDAARTLSLIIVRASGYRPRTFGGHYNTFLALEAADPVFAQMSAYFDGCRMKRNTSEYDFAGGITDTEATALLTTVQTFAIRQRQAVRRVFVYVGCYLGSVWYRPWWSIRRSTGTCGAVTAV